MARWDKDTGPTIPEWFFEAIETEYSTHTVEVDECDVVYQKWGDSASGKPGLLLIHGMFAHSHWWDFIAPAFMEDYTVAAMNLTGMGDSDYRYEYSSTTFAQEIVAVCDDAGFGNDVLVVAHSFGGAMAAGSLKVRIESCSHSAVLRVESRKEVMAPTCCCFLTRARTGKPRVFCGICRKSRRRRNWCNWATMP